MNRQVTTESSGSLSGSDKKSRTATEPGVGPDVKRLRKKVVIFGGNGFVGQGMVKQALKRGLDVISINRSGSPRDFIAPRDCTGTVDWLRSDIFKPEEWREVLHEAQGVISCIGVIQGSNEFMEKMNGDANILAMDESLKAGVPRFVYVSAVENNLPDFVLYGYFRGKRRAEEALQQKFGAENGIILRPGFIYGTRTVHLPFGGDLHLPLWLIGRPVEFLHSVLPLHLIRDYVPGMKAVMAQPVSVEDLAKVGVAAAIGDVPSDRAKGMYNVDDLHSVAKQL